MRRMSYPRAWRPQVPARSFEAMVGQEHVVQALANALTQQRLHHAYLFTGTRGVSKTTVSRILAKSLNCPGRTGRAASPRSPAAYAMPAATSTPAASSTTSSSTPASQPRRREISHLLDQAVYKPVLGAASRSS